MSFVPNTCQRISLFDHFSFLSERKLKMVEKSWAKTFSDYIFVNIDEHIFAPLFSEKPNTRPNTPVNVIVGALILKEFNQLTDDEILEECECDFRYQYALHTNSFEKQPLSDRTFSRFRLRNAEYELATGTDLIHECIKSLSAKIAEYMEISPSVKRMDSMMIESNIRTMGRLELLYTCLADLVRKISRDGNTELIKGLEQYADADNRNKVVYHDKDASQLTRIQKIIDDVSGLLPKCGEKYSSCEEYIILERVIAEQTKHDSNGHNIPKDRNDGMGSDILQNPSDPDATFRHKAGKNHRGYSANITETVDENGSVITDYQYDVNTRSDASFIEEYINQTDAGDGCMLIADGGYSGDEIRRTAEAAGFTLVTTGLSGPKPAEILAEFKTDENDRAVTQCPEGHKPESSSYIKQTDSVRVSFKRDICENCPRLHECNPSLKKKTAVKIIAMKARRKVIHRKSTDSETIALISRIRNGIETVPSVLRRKYNVDRMPVRGRIRTKQFFGFKIAALNFTKLRLSLDGRAKCRAFI